MNKKFRNILLLSILVTALVGCGDEESTETATKQVQTTEKSVETSIPVAKAEETIVEEKAPEPDPEPETVYRDLGGETITIASWFDQLEPEVKRSAQEEALWEFRHKVMDNNNFQFEEIIMGQWNTTLELMSTSTLAGEPAAEIFHLAPSFIKTAIDNGLCYDLASLDSIDLDHWKWDPLSTQVSARGDSIYGIFPDEAPINFLFFNKRILSDAGIDPELMYEWQANGEWTWEKFEEVAEKVTRDLDNDGVYDVYAIETNAMLYPAAVLSNGSRLVDIDENGKYFNNTFDPKVIEALEWANQFLHKHYDVAPSHWDGGIQMFADGGVAMLYADTNKISMLQGMEDDFGLILFPKGPDAQNYTARGVTEVWTIPSSYSKEEAENIAFAMDMWASQAPGYDGKDDWMMTQYKLFRDAESVEETFAMTKEPGVVVIDYNSMINGLSQNDFAHPLIYNGVTVIEALEGIKGEWDGVIANANGEQLAE
ncbi:MAG: hypothetical protein ATN31_10115 [Candidatus Epulonipiscioides saccharophilum]|nr:MAG: hypothetical protein ATN31_10115 [Epulopiscium sp. AS2M-Bin001]